MDSNPKKRYSRQIVLENWGEDVQQKLSNSIVLIIGVGGLGCHSASALCASGIGTLILYDPDRVQLENLHRQYHYSAEDIGLYKVDALAKRLKALNPDCRVLTVSEFWDWRGILPENLAPHLVIDGSDTFQVKYAINEYCQSRQIPWIYASVLAYEAEVSVFMPYSGSCYKCLHPTPPDDYNSCERTGVVGPLPALAGTRQACEAIAFLSGNIISQDGKLWKIDLKNGKENIYQIERSPICRSACTVKSPAFMHLPETGELSFNEFHSDFKADSEKWHLLDIRMDNMAFPDIYGIRKIDLADLNIYVEGTPVHNKVLLICSSGRISRKMMLKLRQFRPELLIYSLNGGFLSGFQEKPYLESL